MVAIPAGAFDFAVHGLRSKGTPPRVSTCNIRGKTARAATIAGAWRSMLLDRPLPGTNVQFKTFLDASGYTPAMTAISSATGRTARRPQTGESKPVTWVALEDARAYAAWAGKRLPREWEWQYAGQGTDGRPLSMGR